MIAIGCDHGGFELKQTIIDYFKSQNIDFEDFGCFDKTSIDYPDIAKPVCESVTGGKCECGILVCGTGIGMSIAANKIKGIRAAMCSDVYSAQMTKRHNNSNLLTLGGRVVGPDLAVLIVKSWLEAEFEGGRHQNRIDKISALEA